jgi:hypothetical protein
MPLVDETRATRLIASPLKTSVAELLSDIAGVMAALPCGVTFSSWDA